MVNGILCTEPVVKTRFEHKTRTKVGCSHFLSTAVLDRYRDSPRASSFLLGKEGYIPRMPRLINRPQRTQLSHDNELWGA